MHDNKRKMHVPSGYMAAAILLLVLAAGCVPIGRLAWLGGPLPSAHPGTLSAAATAGETGQLAAADVAAPPPITHALAKHDACLECHEAEDETAYAEHRNFTEAVCLYCHMPEEGSAAVPPLPAKTDTDLCLGCHGPFEALMAQTEGALTVKDVTVNPHMYVPHETTKFFSCDRCHGVHTLPAPASTELPEANLDYCYKACHHSDDFQPCAACHDEE